ncbi:YndJ family transporter [Prosthecobacter sp. SYSU 5D2]|uniref:YndJ family transporter n=1 Tax=Prosthecobacter sp. SYSU 5D2 TaxID=3134134 RepID=UPI0031FEC863
MKIIARRFPMPEYANLGLGVVICVIFASIKGLEPQAATWIEILLAVAVLILMPMARELQEDSEDLPVSADTEFTAAFLLILALLGIGPAWVSLALTCPWLCLRVWDAGHAVYAGFQETARTPAYLCRLSARIFPAIGAAWLVAYRAGWMPFGFDALIVLLTAAHFHHAGFTLPLMAGLCGKSLPGKMSRGSCLFILAGVPLVALGITCTHFQTLPWVEPLSVCVLVVGALGVALLQMKMAFQKGLHDGAKMLFGLSGVSLFIAMMLALGFGLRYFLPSGALSMRAMWAVHGSLNTFGFGLGGLLAWRCLHKTL